MKHTVKQIDKYYNVNGREVIDFTILNGIKYSVEKCNNKIRGFVCISGIWREIEENKAKDEYNRIVNIITHEVQNEIKMLYN